MTRATRIKSASVGEFLQLARERAGLTQSDVSNRLGIASSYPSHDETGHSRVPPTRLRSLADLYELSKAEIKDLLDLAALADYKRVDISTLSQKSQRKILEVVVNAEAAN